MVTEALCDELCKLTEEEWRATKIQLDRQFDKSPLAGQYSLEARRRMSGERPKDLFEHIKSFLKGYRYLDPDLERQ